MRDKRLATATAAGLAAFAVAHLMQFGLSAGRALSDDTRAAPVGVASFLTGGQRAEVDVRVTPTAPDDPPAIVLVRPPRAEGRVAQDAATPSLPPDDAVNRFGQLCRRALVAAAEPGGLLRARLDAPCDPEVRAEFRHAGLRFAVSTGPEGSREIVMPAMAVAAEIAVHFADGSVVSARARVPDAARVWRVAIVTEGEAGVSLHTGVGVVRRLGDPGLAAPVRSEVHSLPAGRLGPLSAGAPRLDVLVSTANCARDMVADVVRAGPDGAPDTMTLRLAMPDCGAVGDMVTLDLPLPAARLARN